MIKIYNYGEVSNEEIFSRENIANDVADIVREIIENVKVNGDKALYEYCLKFANEWVYSDIKYRCGEGVCFDESDFIDYIDCHLSIHQSIFIKNLGSQLPKEYKQLPRFNF